MIQDHQDLEAQLRALRPVAPAPEFAERLAAIARRAPGTLTAAEAETEAALRTLTPSPLPAALESAILERTSRSTPKVIAFPTAAPAPATRRWGRLALPIAAAVALLGAATALLVPTAPRGTGNATAANGNPGSRVAAPLPADLRQPAGSAAGFQSFVPAGLDTRLHQANDEGVIWAAPDQPHRVLQVIYNDRVTLMDQHGRMYPVERPRVEYILLPEKID